MNTGNLPRSENSSRSASREINQRLRPETVTEHPPRVARDRGGQASVSVDRELISSGVSEKVAVEKVFADEKDRMAHESAIKKKSESIMEEYFFLKDINVCCSVRTLDVAFYVLSFTFSSSIFSSI